VLKLISLCRRPPQKNEKLLLLAGILVATINGALFANVYWLNADDVMFLQFSLEGWRAVFEAVKLYSTAQGRFGQTVLMPMNILAAYLSQFALFRIFAIGLFFASIWAFLYWFDRVVHTNIRALAFLLCAGLSVLHFYHLPPTSFPLQNTVPYLVLVLARLAIWRGRSSGTSFTMLWALPLFSLTMSLSEYALLFATGMLAVEYLALLCRQPNWSTVRSLVRSSYLYVDFAACLLPLMIYIGWRMLFPSAYDGNNLDGFSDPALAAQVWWLHAFGLHGLALPQGWVALSTRWWPSLVAGCTVFGAIFVALPRMETIKRPFVAAALALFFALYVTFPPAMTAKQQQWCAEQGACVFLDSRTAYPATMVVFVLIGGAVWAASRNTPILGGLVRSVLALFAAAATALTLAHNAWMVEHMDNRMAVWRGAEKLSCTVLLQQAGLRNVVDPQGTIDIHPHLDADNFWRIYLTHAREDCLAV